MRQAHTDGRPVTVGEKREMQVTLGAVAVGRCFMPRADEGRALAQGVFAKRLELEDSRRGDCRHESSMPSPAKEKAVREERSAWKKALSRRA